MKVTFKMMVAVLVMLLALPMLTYAAGGSDSAAGQFDHKLSIMVNFNMPEPPRDNSDMLLYLRNTLKADIDFNWYPTPAYGNALGVRLSANDLPDAVVVRGSAKPANIVSAVRDCMFWELDPYLSNPAWPGLAKLSPDRYNNIRIDGKVYGLPIERELVQAGVLYRQDWLDNLGIAEPRNMDDIWNIIQAFSQRNPDGSGREITGLSMKGSNLSGKVTDVSVYYGGQMEWYWDPAARIVRHQTEDPAFYRSMDFHRDAYARRFFVQDLVELTDEYLPIDQGRAGLVFFSDFNDVVDTQLSVSAVFPEARINFTQRLIGPNGNIVNRSHIGFNGGFYFPRTASRNQARFEEVLRFFDLLGSDDAILTLRRGIRDKHYTVQNGVLAATADQIRNFRERDFPDAQLITPFGVTRVIPEGFSDPLTQAIFDSMINYDGDRFLSISDVYISETAVRLGGTLSQILSDARMRYVLGDINRAQFDSEVARWRAAGGDQVQRDYTTVFTANPW